MNRFLVFGAALLVPTAASAMPFFNHYYNESGYFIDVNNAEARGYQCRMKFDLVYDEAGKSRSQVVEQTVTIPAKWSGRIVAFPSTPQSILRSYRYDINCD